MLRRIPFGKFAAALVAAVLLAAIAAVAWNPYLLVRGEFARQRIAAGLSQHSVEVAGFHWVYATRDADVVDAPTVVMIHGFTGGKENWYPLARELRGRYRVVIPDLPGWGASERKPGADYGFVAQAERVAAFIRAVSPGKPVVLLGHSMGGGITALVAARHPELVSRVGLLDAAGVRFRDNRFGEEVLAGKNPFAVTDDASLHAYLDVLFFDKSKAPAIPWPASVGFIRQRRADAAFEQSVLDKIGRGPQRFLPGEEAANIHQPALLLWCKQDAVIDASALDLYAARMPQARKLLLDGCGHMSITEQPHNVAMAVESLIEQGVAR
ncbi:alpha/beta hydrolase [Pseudoluteimonas lycopersici]|uniref:Alpha/beta hydrolase n=1 Tax=Pseudoluteimonas lycopersici TaxID=1324796 RepID=A0A516V6X3_9GAMM|nr:alpha/beta hydrolase [Lysobacter lycopersici]QDQ74289.1 alpha/beta hydrolase [Lysobacter lycopersici]